MLKLEQKKYGIPPYKVSSNLGVVREINDPTAEQWTNAATLIKVLNLMIDITSKGTDLDGQRVLDSKGVEVMTVNNPADVSLIKRIVKLPMGIYDVKVI